MRGTNGVNRRWLALLVVAAGLLFFLKIGMPLTDGDSAYYGTIARRVVETGDWVTLHSKERDFVDKPPLSIWTIAVAYKLFGVSDWATRLLHSLISAGTVLLTYALARRFYRVRAALLGAAVLLTSLLLAYTGQVPQQDVPLTFLSVLAFYGFVRYLQEGRLLYGLLFFAGTGLAVLNRGLQGVVFPAAVAGLHLAVRAVAKRRFWLPPAPDAAEPAARPGPGAVLGMLLGGAALFLLIAVPWYYLGFLRQGPEFLNYFFGSGNTRYLKEIRPGGAWDSIIYLPMLILGFLPWSGFVFPALGQAWRDGRTKPGAGSEHESPAEGALFLAAWFLVAFFLPFSIRWRVIRYLLPAFPPLAVLIGRLLDLGLVKEREGRSLRSSAWLTLATGALFLLSVIVAARPFPTAQAGFRPVLLPFLVLFTLTLVAGAGAMLVFRRPGWMAGLLLAGSLVTYLTLFQALDHSHYLLNPWKEAAQTVNAEVRPGDRIVCYGDLPVSSFLRLDVVRRIEEGDETTLARWLGETVQPGETRRLFVLSTAEALQRYRQGHPEVPWRLTRFRGGKVLAVAGSR